MVSSPQSSTAQPADALPPASAQVSVSHQSDRQGEVIDGRYRIMGCLGEGNSGTTHRAQRITDGVIVALKELSLQGSQSWKLIELFEREVAMLQQLDHPAIPRYIDSFLVDSDQDRRYYLAQTLAEGKTLTAWIESGWRCTEADAQAVALQLLEVLDYLQRCNPPIIHRDIKPLNIIRREDGQIFLVDFGAVGHTYHNTFMRGSTVVGTFGYMAPEQFRGQACTATDLYSLGATLLYLLTRRSPADLPAQQLKVDFRSKVLLSDGFADWLTQLIEPSLRHRFASATVALTTLKRLQKEASQDQGLLKPALKILGGLSIIGLIALFTINQYKYSVLRHLGTENELQAAIAAGDIPVTEYLDRGGDISFNEDQGQTLLILAIQQADLASVERLIDQGVSPSLADRQGQTSLHVAAAHLDSNLLAAILPPAQQLDIHDRQGNTPLHLTASAEHAMLLLNAGANPEQRPRNGKSTLQTAIENDWYPVIHKYLDLTKDIPKAVPETPSLLAIAVDKNDLKSVKLLKWGGARFTYRGEGSDLMAKAIGQQNWELCSLLLEMDAELDERHITAVNRLMAQGRQPSGAAFIKLLRAVQKQEKAIKFELRQKQLLFQRQERDRLQAEAEAERKQWEKQRKKEQKELQEQREKEARRVN